MGNTSVSIVIAASTAPHAVAGCVGALVAQTRRPTEIIIAGAANVLDLPSLRRLASTTAIPLRVYTHTGLPCLAHDLNFALPLVRGDFVSCIEAEQTWAPHVLEQLAAGRGEHVWVYAGRDPVGGESDLARLVESGQHITALLFPRELADMIGPFDPATDSCEWWEIALQLSLLVPGRRVAVSDIKPVTRVPVPACAAQVLRKHAIHLKARLPHFSQSAHAGLRSLPGDTDAIDRALHSLAYPYFEPAEAPGSQLTFLVSAPRSGSTLLQRVLAAHPDVQSQPEPWIMLNPCHGLRETGVDGEYEPALAARAVNGFLEHAGGGQALYNEAVRLMSDHLYGAAMVGSGARLFVDKTPRYYHILPELRAIYPHARFVFLLRHPLAVVSSALDTWFDGDIEAFRENANALDCVAAPRCMMKAIEALGEAAVVVHYENLVRQPEDQVRQLCNALGLTYDPAMLDYAGVPFAFSEFGDQENIARHDHPVDDYADCWREKFRDEARAALALDIVGELGPGVFDAMGYDYADAQFVLGNAGRAADVSAQADVLTRDGESRFATGDFDGAEALFNEALAADPGFALAHNNLGVLFAARGRDDDAIDRFVQALEINPAERGAMINLIECAARANRLRDTLTSLAAYLQAVPGDTEVMAMAREVTDVIESAARADREAAAAPVPSLPRGPEILVPGEAPRISIVTPSYNQGDFLEACIDSILGQNYPNLEYIIMDGGSTDQSVSIIKRYEKYLSHWQSGADDGQYAAIEAGLQRSNGEIMAWLNSDDKYHADALWKVSYAFMTRPQVEWLTGLYTFWDELGTLTGVLDPVYWTQAQQLDPTDMRTVQQESTFWRRSLWDRAGGRLATELYYAGDWDLWTRFFAHADLHTLEWTLGGYRYHEGQKVGNDGAGYTAEANRLLERELERCRSAGITPRDTIPAPIRFEDEELLELREWRESNLPADRYQSKSSQRKQRSVKKTARVCLPSVSVVTSVSETSPETDDAIGSWLRAGWDVVSVSNAADAERVAERYDDVTVVETGDVAALRDQPEAVTFRAILARASASTADITGLIQPEVIIEDAAALVRNFAGASSNTFFYGEKYAVNSTAVLDGIADGYGYFFGAPASLARFNPGNLTFGHEWWIHWLLMTAIADQFRVNLIGEPHAYRIRKPFATPYDEQVQSSKACIASVLAKYLPREFTTIPSLKLSFDIESADFEKFARSFVAARAA